MSCSGGYDLGVHLAKLYLPQGSRKRVGNEDWGVKWNRSEERATVLREIKELNEEAIARNEEIPENLRREYSTSFMFQLKVCFRLQRLFLSET